MSEPAPSLRAAGRAAMARPSIPPFQRFLEEHGALVYRFLLAQVGPRDADDCFQETFLAALRAYPTLRDGSNLRGWVLTIATRKAIDAARAGRRRPLALERLEEGAGSSATAVRDDPADGLLDPEEPVWRAVRALPPKQRAAVVHRFVLDASYQEVAATLGTSEDAARANVYQGLRKLRAAFAAEMERVR